MEQVPEAEVDAVRALDQPQPPLTPDPGPLPLPALPNLPDPPSPKTLDVDAAALPDTEDAPATPATPATPSIPLPLSVPMEEDEEEDEDEDEEEDGDEDEDDEEEDEDEDMEEPVSAFAKIHANSNNSNSTNAKDDSVMDVDENDEDEEEEDEEEDDEDEEDDDDPGTPDPEAVVSPDEDGEGDEENENGPVEGETEVEPGTPAPQTPAPTPSSDHTHEPGIDIIKLANVKQEIEPESDTGMEAELASRMFRHCIFCYNHLPPRPIHGDEDENLWMNENDPDSRSFEIVTKYLQLKLDDTFQKFVNNEGLPSTATPFCSNCRKTIESLLQLDEKLNLIQTQITSRIEFLTSNIMQSTQKEIEFLQAQAQQENKEPEYTPAAGRVFNNLRKKVLNRFCPRVLLIPLEKERMATRRLTRLRKPEKPKPALVAATDGDVDNFDPFDSPALESGDDRNSDSDFQPEEKPTASKRRASTRDNRYRKRLRKRKSADTEFITVEPEIPFIKEEAASDSEPDGETTTSKSSAKDVTKKEKKSEDEEEESEAEVPSENESSEEDEEDSDFEVKKKRGRGRPRGSGTRKRQRSEYKFSKSEKEIDGLLVEFVKSEKGKDILICDGYTYNFHGNGIGKKTFWRCTSVRTTKCKGRIHIRGQKVIFNSSNHICTPPDADSLERLKVLSQIRTIAKSSSDPPSEVLAKTIEGLPESVTDWLPTLSAMKRSIRRIRGEVNRAPRRPGSTTATRTRTRGGPRRRYTFKNRERKPEDDPYRLITKEDGTHWCGDIEIMQVSGGFKCTKCFHEDGKIFGSLFKARAHTCTHFLDHQCDVCGKHFSSRSVMRKHKHGVHERTFVTKCDICLRPFKTFKAVISHKWHHQSEEEKQAAIANGVEPPPPPQYRSTVGIYPCEICGSILKSKGSLFKHVQNHTALKTHMCETCGKSFTVNGLRDHKRYCHITVSTHRIWHCNICEKSYNTKDNLRRHLNSVHKENTVLCEVCQKPMKGPKGIPGHVWTHKSAQEKLDWVAAGHKAPVTGKEHYKKQIGEFPCAKCTKILTSKGALVKHLQRHVELEAGKTYLCPDCGKMFPTSEDMKSHQRYIHVVVNDRKHFICKTCGMRFAVESRMKLHEMTHTGEKPYTCNVCGKSFRRAHPLKKHMRTHEVGSGTDFTGEQAAPRRPAGTGRSRKSKPKPLKEPERIQLPSASNSSEFQSSEPSHGGHSSSYHHHLHSPNNGNLVIPAHAMNYQHAHQHSHPNNNPMPYDPLNYTNYIYQGGFNLSNM